MKTRTHLAAVAGAALAVAMALPAGAADPDRGLYFNAEAGANWASDVSVGGGGSAALDIGFRFGAAVGYNINKYVGVEFDTGWVWNNFKDFDGSLSHIPIMANAVFRYPISTKWEAYAGGGVGGSYSILNVDDFGVSDSSGDFVFAWQGLAGVRYKLKENMTLGVGYKYFGTAEGNYDIAGASVSIGNVHNHTVGVVFNMKF